MHALTTDCNLNKAPRRRTDHALVIDTSKCMVKHYGEDGGVKLLKRRSGALEKQYRINIGKLPFAYRTEPNGRYLYIMDDALTTYSMEGTGAEQEHVPVPPCIVGTEKGTLVTLELEDRSPRRLILKISADAVRMQIKSSIQNPGAVAEEIADFMKALLGVKLSAVSLERGSHLRQKILQIQGVQPEEVFRNLYDEYHKLSLRPR